MLGAGRHARARHVLEVVVLRRLYDRSHLDQVLGTFGLILFFNDAVRMIWGAGGPSCRCPRGC